MIIKRNVVRFLRYINRLTDELIDRLMYIKELREWERQKRKEGFPAEWFLSDEQLEQLNERENYDK